MIALYVFLSPTFLNLFDNKTCTAHLLVSYYSQSSRTTHVHVNHPTHRNMTNFYFCAFKIINPTTTRRVKSVAQVRPRVPVIKLIDYFVDESGLSLSLLQILTALGKSWHPEHFVCSVCSQPITEGSFNQRDGMPVCSPCYVAKFTDICQACNQPILGVIIDCSCSVSIRGIAACMKIGRAITLNIANT